MTTDERLEAMRLRVDEAAHAIDSLADLMSDSTELRVNETPVISRLNEILSILTNA